MDVKEVLKQASVILDSDYSLETILDSLPEDLPYINIREALKLDMETLLSDPDN